MSALWPKSSLRSGGRDKTPDPAQLLLQDWNVTSGLKRSKFWFVAVIAAGLLMLAVIGSATYSVIHHEEKAIITAALRENSRVATAIDRHVTLVFRVAESVLHHMRHEIGHYGGNIKKIETEVRELYEEHRDILTTVTIADRTGKVIAAAIPSAGLNIASTAHFQQLSAVDDGKTAFGVPLYGQKSKRWTLHAAVRRNAPDGSFAGTVSVGVDLGLLQQAFAEIVGEGENVIVLAGLDGIERMRSNVDQWREQLNHYGETQVLAEVREGREGGDIDLAVSAAGDHRLISYRRLSPTPLFVVSEQPVRPLLQTFALVRQTHLAVARLLSLLVAALCLLMLWRLRREQQAFEILRHHAALHRDLFYANPVPMWIWNEDSYGFLAVNDAAVEHYGYSRDEFLRMSLTDIWDKQDTDLYRKQLLDRQRDVRLSTRLRRRHRRRNGEIRQVEITARELFEGQPLWLTAINDYTEADKAAEAMVTSENRLRLAMLASRMAMWDWDIQGNKVYLDDHWSAMLGGPQQSTSTTFSDLGAAVHPDDCDRARKLLTSVLKGEARQYSCEHRVRGLNGQWVWIASLGEVTLRDDNGRALRMTGTNTDISARKDAEAVLQAYAREREALSKRLLEAEEAERGELSRELHDRVGQDLTAIHLNMDMIGHLLPEGTRQSVKDKLEDTRGLLRSAIRHVRNLMADLRPEGLHDFGLGAALQAYAVRMAERSGLVIEVQGEIQGEIQSEIQGEMPGKMQGKMRGEAGGRLSTTEEVALFRIVQEALHNAIKHAHGKRVEIGWDAQKRELHVRDDGSGFDPGREGMGGYGLRVMRERAQAVGAELVVDSAPGKGTCIRVRLAQMTEDWSQEKI